MYDVDIDDGIDVEETVDVDDVDDDGESVLMLMILMLSDMMIILMLSDMIFLLSVVLWVPRLLMDDWCHTLDTTLRALGILQVMWL